ncbi:hypothetical protein PPL_01935 [Heterostelium album PN500]|uniref:Uncharacterized protein n=1 Tax=Heterostelium pallidum (strain ATCC 26659 / Pp 5 / PN500) TaxID=670386 RepID=D3B0W8_HETP5|nr:hypothetical protein PPL_01935 [Heterostelium album PN500]EFA84942.1 hypothetical protein PPL_01935 [Heterostelium album PN500]|eukprot:XP_020437052.1 hypothetical protein PPL_01935 [Heterostelium album PN500]
MDNWRKISITPVLNANGNNQSPNRSSPQQNSTDEATDSVPKPLRYQIPDNDFYSYLIGTWKRNLEWKEFGGLFPHIRTSNTVVMIEEYRGYDNDPSARHLKWSFGKSLEKSELRFGYSMKCVQAPKNTETYLEWTYIGTVCHGKYLPSTNVAVLNFFQPQSTVLVTYRVIDENTMSVCVVEVDKKQTPSIQYGNIVWCRDVLMFDIVHLSKTINTQVSNSIQHSHHL